MHDYFAKRAAYIAASTLSKRQDNSTEEVGHGQSK